MNNFKGYICKIDIFFYFVLLDVNALRALGKIFKQAHTGFVNLQIVFSINKTIKKHFGYGTILTTYITNYWHRIVFFFINSNIFIVKEKDIEQNSKT